MRQKAREKGFLWSLLMLAVSAAYVTCFWQYTSPTHKQYVALDSACFYVIGKGILNGKVPYVDYIDNKGPVTYLIYAAAARIGHFPWGVWAIGTLCVFLSLLGICMICRRLEIRRFYLVQLLFLVSYALICPEGGITEDLAIPFCIWAFCVVADFYRSDLQDVFRFRSGFLIGVLFWLCAMTRVNNAVSIAAAAVCVGVRLLFGRKFKRFGLLLLSFLIGSAAAVTPIALWLLRHGALKECLDQVLLNNFKYNSAANAMSKREIFLSGSFAVGFYLILAVCLFCIVVFRQKDKQDGAFLRRSALCITGVSVLSCLSFTQNFPHYLLCLMPALAFCLVLPFAGRMQSVTGAKKWLAGAAAAVLFVCGFLAFDGAHTVQRGFWYAADTGVMVLRHNSLPQEEWKAEWDRAVDSIPTEERDSVFAVNINPKWYIYADLDPCKRMFVCAELFTAISPEYEREFRGYFQNDPPKWLIVKEYEAPASVAGFDEILSERYQLTGTYDPTGENLLLYHLKELEHA